MRTLAPTLLLLAAAALAGCDGDPTAAGPPARLNLVSGNDQQGTVGQELAQPLVVEVLDDDGRPVRGQLVNFRVTRGGGSVFAGSAVTNRDGIARELWTLGTVADSQRVEARAVDPETGAALVFAVFRAVATPAGAASIAAVQATVAGQPGTPVADSVAAVVKDQYGNPVPGVTVNWAVTSGGGSVSPASSTTNAQGIARARWTLGGSVAAAQALRASSGASMNATFTATAAVGAGATLSAVSGGGQTSQILTEFPQPLVVEVRQNNVPVEGAQVQWTSATGTFGPLDQATATTTTDVQGRASVRWKPGSQAGTQTATARLMDATVTFTGTATAGTPNFVGATGIPATVGPGTTLLPRYRVTDGYGNPVAGVAVQFTATLGTVTPASATSDASGYIDVSWALPQLIGGFSAGAQLTARAMGTPASSTAQTTVVAVPTQIVASVETATVAAGATISFNASLRDDFGNVWSPRGYNGCGVGWSGPAGVELTPIFGLLYPQVNVRSDTPGTYTLMVTCNPLGLSDTITLTVN